MYIFLPSEVGACSSYPFGVLSVCPKMVPQAKSAIFLFTLLLILTFIALKVQYAFALHFISYRLLTLGLYWHLVGVSSVSYFYALSFVVNVSKLVESRSPRTFYRM